MKTTLALIGIALTATMTLAGNPADATPKKTATVTGGLVVIGDSFSSGLLGYGEGPNGWPQRFADSKGLTLTLNAIPGTGYATSSYSGVSFAQRWRDGLTAETQLVIIAGSQNDHDQDPKTVYSKASAIYKAIRTVSPAAKIVAVGPMWGYTPDPQYQPIEDAVRYAATANNVQFVDGSDWLAPYPWDVCQGHPNDAGHGILYARIRDAITL